MVSCRETTGGRQLADVRPRPLTTPFGPRPHLGHDHVLTLLHVLALGLDDGVQEVEVLDVAAVRCQAVDEVLQDALGDLAAQLVVVAEDVPHRLRLQQLQGDVYLDQLMTSETVQSTRRRSLTPAKSYCSL